MEILYAFIARVILPRAFRRRYLAALLQAYRAERVRPENQGALGFVLFWHELAADLLMTAVRLRIRGALRILLGSRSRSVAFAGLPMSQTQSQQLQEEFMPTANDRLKQNASTRFWLSMVFATLLHAGAFYMFPSMSAAVEVDRTTDMTVLPALDIPLPPAPERVSPPARPIPVAGIDVNVVPAPMSELWDQAPKLPPPPATAGSTMTRTAWTGPVSLGPRLQNRAEIERALESHYPALLRDAGIGGKVHVAFFVIDDGSVADRRISTPSKHPALDEAALAVADLMRFSPAMNRDRPVSVWVTFPVEFTTKR